MELCLFLNIEYEFIVRVRLSMMSSLEICMGKEFRCLIEKV